MTPVQQKRLGFWDHNRELAMAILGNPEIGDLNGRMIVVADMRDEVGKPLVEALSKAKGVNARAHVQKTEKKGEIPTAILVLPIEAVAKIVAAPNPRVSETLQQMTTLPEHVWVAIIAEGGTMLIQAPIEPIKAQGNG